MASGFTVGGVDLDSLFKPRTGAPGPATGFTVGGVDLNDRYEVSTGGDQIPGNTGFTVSGVDLKQFFRDIAYVPPDTPIVIAAGDPPTTVFDGGFVYNFTAGVNNADFHCAITAGNNVAWEWFKDSVSLGLSGTGGNAPATFQGPIYTPVAVPDAGFYECRMSNGAGNKTGSATMNVAP